MAASDFEQIPSEILVPLEIPQKRTVSEELAFCQILYQNRDSRKAIEPIYEKQHKRIPEEQKAILERRRERECSDKKIKTKRSPSLPPTPFIYDGTRKNSPRTVCPFR